MSGTSGKLKTGDTVKFFWKNKSTTGVVVTEGSRSECEAELVKLGKKASRISKAATSDRVISTDLPSVSGATRTTRSNKPPTKSVEPHEAESGPSSKNKETAMANEDKRRRDLFEMNKKTAEKYGNQNILASVKGKERDVDYVPESQHSPAHSDNDFTGSEDSDTTLQEYSKKNVKRKNNGKELVKGIKRLKDDGDSPSKESLRVKVLEFETKLEMLYEERQQAIEEKEALKKKLEQLSGNREGNEQQLDQTAATLDLDNHDTLVVAKDKLNEQRDNKKTDEGDDSFPNHSPTSSPDKPKPSAKLGEDECDEDFEAIEHLKVQLYGKAKDTTLLLEHTYCKTVVLQKALRQSASVIHVARRLLGGVFKLSAITSCTLTGQPWRAGGSSDMIEQDPLYPPAVTEIIDYAKHCAGPRKWKIPKVDKDIKHSMSQRIGELKRAIKQKGEDYVWKKMIL